MTEALIRGGPGLRSVKDMPVVQDGPPPGARPRRRTLHTTAATDAHTAGGFPSVRFGRRIPNTGPTGTAIFGVSALVIAYGFYKAWRRGRALGFLHSPRGAAPDALRSPRRCARQVGQGNHKRRCVPPLRFVAPRRCARTLPRTC